MATVKVTVECSKETLEGGLGVAAFVGHVKAAIADGWQLGTDVPAVVSAALTDLIPAIAGIEKAKDELTEDKVAFANAVTQVGTAIVNALLK